MKLPYSDITLGAIIGFGILYISSIMSKNKENLQVVHKKVDKVEEAIKEIEDKGEIWLEDDTNVPSQYKVRIAGNPYWRED